MIILKYRHTFVFFVVRSKDYCLYSAFYLHENPCSKFASSLVKFKVILYLTIDRAEIPTVIPKSKFVIIIVLG